MQMKDFVESVERNWFAQQSRCALTWSSKETLLRYYLNFCCDTFSDIIYDFYLFNCSLSVL